MRALPLELVGIQLAHGVEQRCLHAGEREDEPRHFCDGKVECLRIAVLRDSVDLRAAGVAETEETRAFVERPARRVVDRRPERARRAAALLHVEQQRVSAAGEQTQERRLKRMWLE